MSMSALCFSTGTNKTNRFYSHPDARISTALVLPGSNIANHFKLFDRMKAVLRSIPHVHVVSISSKDIVNLKTAIALIIKTITEKEDTGPRPHFSTTSGSETADDTVTYDKRLRYDLEILADWCRASVRKDPSLKSLSDMRIVISIDDAHSFDVSILSSIITQLHSYITQIPIKLVLSIATSIDVFQENLRQSCIRMMEGVSINAHLTGCLEEVILDTVLESSHTKSILIGPTTFRNIIRRQRESLESIDSFVSALKYTYMTYYYSNPLSIIPTLFFNNNSQSSTMFLTPSHYAAVRLLPSFKTLVQNLVSTNPQKVRPLFDDDSVLREYIQKGVGEFIVYRNNLLYGIMVLEALQQYTYQERNEPQVPISRIDLYSAGLLGEIPKSPWFEHMRRNYAKGDVTALAELLRLIDGNRDPNIWPCAIDPAPAPFAELRELIMHKHGMFLEILLDPENDNSPRHNANTLLDDPEIASKFVITFTDISNSFFSMLLAKVFPLENPNLPRQNPKDIGKPLASYYPMPGGSGGVGPGNSYKSYFLHELFVVDTPALHENVFVPTYRAAIDMALSNPRHYWGDISVIAARAHQKVNFENYLRDKKLKESNSSVSNSNDKAQEPRGSKRKQNGDLAANSSKASQNTNGSDSTDALQSENEWSSSSMAYDPHLCIMYTLYRESALYINIYDYYTAFMSVIKQPQDEDDPLFERKALAWFLQGVAELKALGILRDSKRKFECVEKLVWRDL